MPDYTDLLTRGPTQIYAQNRTLVTEMPTIIQQAETQVIQRLDHDAFRTHILGKTIGTDGRLDLSAEPNPVLELRAIRLKYKGDDDWTPLERREIEQLTMLFARNRPARPRYYAEDEGELLYRVYPQPFEVMDAIIVANVTPVPLSDQDPSNVLTQRYFRVIENAVYRQAAIFMKNMNDVQMFTSELNDAIQEANAQIARRRRDETGTRPIEAANQAGA